MLLAFTAVVSILVFIGALLSVTLDGGLQPSLAWIIGVDAAIHFEKRLSEFHVHTPQHSLVMHGSAAI